MSSVTSCTSNTHPAMCAPPGERYEEVKRRQSPSPAAAAKALAGAAKAAAKEAAVEALAHQAARLGPVGGAAGPLATAVCMTASIYDSTIKKWNAEGRERNEALVRDNRDMAILMIATTSEPGLVPSEYLNARKCAVIGSKKDPTTHVSGRLASRVMVDAQRGDADAKALHGAIMTNFRAGRSAAYRMDIRSDQALKNALASDRAFAHAYTTDPAFHQAVEAVRYQGSVDPVIFERNRASVMKTAMQSEELRNTLIHHGRTARA